MKKKSLSVKKITPRNFNFKKILNNKKIFKIYTNFVKNFENLNISGKVAVSVSGGSDSMALCFLILCYKFQKNKKIQPFFYLVDHRLRENSGQEAELVKNQLKLKKINLKILQWYGKKPTSNLQSLARKKRYQLIFNECKKKNISIILTGHHQEDVYETFFSRLLRGSGTEGLSSFLKTEKLFNFKDKKIVVVRPLLNLTKQDLIYVSSIVFKFYVKDPSNELEIFQRIRIRKLILSLKNQGLDFKKLSLTLNNLSSTNKTISQIVDQNIYNNVTFLHKNKYLINFNFFLMPEEITFRSLSVLFKNISKKDYPPRGKKMISLIKELKNKQYIKATLGGTIIEKIHNSVIVSKEKTKKR